MDYPFSNQTRNMKTIRHSSLVHFMCLILSLFVFSTYTSIEQKVFVQSRSIDSDDFCQLKLYRRQYFTDPNPKKVDRNSRHLKMYKVKSVRSIGKFSKNGMKYTSCILQ